MMKIKLKKLEEILSEEDYVTRKDGTIEFYSLTVPPDMFCVFGKEFLVERELPKRYMLSGPRYWVNKRWVDKVFPDKEYVRMPELEKHNKYYRVRSDLDEVVHSMFSGHYFDRTDNNYYNVYRHSPKGKA